MPSKKANESLKAGRNDENGACGNVDFRNTCYEIRTMLINNRLYPLESGKTWLGKAGCQLAAFKAFTTMWPVAFIQ